MATRSRRKGATRRKPGPVPGPPRKQCTIRFPIPTHDAIVAKAHAAGYKKVNDYVVALVEQAFAADVTPPVIALPLAA